VGGGTRARSRRMPALNAPRYILQKFGALVLVPTVQRVPGVDRLNLVLIVMISNNEL